MKLSKVIFLMAILLVAGAVTSGAAAAIDLGTNTGITGANTTVPQGTLKVNVYPSTVGVGKSVKIIVSTAVTNTPVSNADVYVKSVASLNWKYVGETDSNGQVTYKFSNAGLYTVKAEKSGYLPGTTTVTVKPVGRLIVSARVVGYSPACTLKSFGSLQEVLSKCGENVKVLVRVTDENGNPVQGADVKVTPYSASGYTNASGEVCFTLPPGTYVITATKENYLPGANVSITISKKLVEKLAKEFMEKAVNTTKKTLNKTERAINETLDVLHVSVTPRFVNVNEPQSVTVKVTFNGKPVSDAYVKIEKEGVVVAQGYTDADGRYVYEGPFETGLYLVSVSKTGYRTGFAAFVAGKVPVFVHVLPYVGPNFREIVKVESGPLEKVVMNFGSKAEKVVLEVKKLEKLPKKIEKPKGIVYAVMEINVTNESAVKNATIYFNVSKRWLSEHGFSKNSIVLERYHNGWVILPTKVVGEDSNNVYYSATTPSFSVYAITAVQSSKLNPTPASTSSTTSGTSTTSTPTPTTKKTPGFGAVFAVASLLAAAYLLRKRDF